MSAGELRWHVHDDAAAAVAAATGMIAAHAAERLASPGRFAIVLAGGSTPRAVYEAAASFTTDWRRWEFYFGDERCVPRGHAERNDRMAHEAWLDRIAIAPEQVHPIPAELGPEAGAARYAAALEGVGPFDLVLVGCGSDGHTASLFPGRPLGAEPEAPDALPVRDSPKPPPERVTLSAARLARTRAMLLLAVGEDKRAALRALDAGADIPLRVVIPPSGLDILTDRAAYGA